MQKKESIDFRVATSLDDLIKCFVIRGIVFCEGQDIPYDIERDDKDLHSYHWLGEHQGEPIATGRMRILAHSTAKFERIAVRQSHRGQGVGFQLMEVLLSYAKEQGCDKAIVNAQSYLEDFYTRLGFTKEGNTFIVANIPHVKMRMNLTM